jgi:ribonucleases P/MRP protein subunit RPP40
MDFNIAKCKVMHIGRTNIQHKYTMAGQELAETAEERDVGITVSQNLKPTAQCQKAAKTAQLALSQIGRTFHFRDRHVFMRLYKQYVRPHLEFAAQAWSPWTESDKKCLEDVQRRAVKMVSGLASREYEDRLAELGLTTLEERRHQADMHQVYKIVHGKDHVEGLLELASTGERVTRFTTDPWSLKIPAGRLEIRRNFFTVRVPALWNSIPVEIRSANSLNKFKAQYKEYRRTRLIAAHH